MGKRQMHSYSQADKLSAIRLYEAGNSSIVISQKLGYAESCIRYWVSQYRAHGADGLMRPPLVHHPVFFKEAVVRDIVENLLSLQQASIKYRIGAPTAARWVQLVKSGGYEALTPIHKPPKNMGRPKTKTPESEADKQAAELRYLRAENAYLKKVRALVEKRVALESGRQPKPSKD